MPLQNSVKYTKQLLNGNGNTSDIITAVMNVYAKDWQQCNELANSFKANDIKSTCYAIYNYLLQNVRYKEDPNGEQWIKTPARLIADKTGDCKSYSIFLASCLKSLGIKHCFRFVAYAPGDYTHVYVIAFDEQQQPILIDAVAYVQRKTPFNNEVKFHHKKDIVMNGTKISYLAGLGATNQLPYWTDGKTDLKLNEIELFSLIDLLQAKATITTSQTELDEIYNLMDLYYTAIKLIETYPTANNLEFAGLVLAAKKQQGLFNNHFTTIEQRVENQTNILNSLIKEIDSYLSASSTQQQYIIQASFLAAVKDFTDWWKAVVLAQNYNPTTAKVSGIGTTYAQWSQLVKDSGPYWLYATSKQKLPSKATTKQAKHYAWIDWVLSQNTGLNRATVMNNIESGIITATGKTSQTVINELKSGSISGIGDSIDWGSTETWSSITNALGAVTNLISTVNTVFNPTTTPNMPTTQQLQTYQAMPSDWNSGTSITTLIVGGTIVTAGIIYFKKNKSKKAKTAKK